MSAYCIKKTRYKPHKFRRLKIPVEYYLISFMDLSFQYFIFLYFFSTFQSRQAELFGSIGPQGHPLSQQILFHKIPYLNVLFLYYKSS